MAGYRVVHRVVAGEEYESLQRLTGNDQQFVRSGASVCGTIGGHLLAGARLNLPSGEVLALERYYSAGIVGIDRVAGRMAWVVELIPKDDYRFGMILSIDQENSLLLSHVIFDASKLITLERMQFVSLAVGEPESESESESEPETEAAELDVNTFPAESDLAKGVSTRQVQARRCVTDSFSPTGSSPWKPTWLPPGFILTGYFLDEETGHMETYTDGVSSFSIFVNEGADIPESMEKLKTGGGVYQGVSSRGANMVLLNSTVVDNVLRQISVVGEVPLSTAQKVSLSVRNVVVPSQPAAPVAEP